MPDSSKHMVAAVPQDVQEAAAGVASGLTGVWQMIAQLGATGLICFLFYVQFQANLQQAAEDRRVYREQIDAFLREANSAHLEAVKTKISIEANTSAIRDLSLELRKTRLDRLPPQ